MANPIDPRQPAVNTATVGVPRAARDVGLRSYMLSVYNYMASGVLLTGIVAMLFAPYARDALFNQAGTGMNPLGWIVTLAPLGFVMAMSFGLNRMSTSTLQLLYWAFATVMGLSMSTIFLAYTGVSIAQTFFAVSAGFAGLSLWGYTTKKDLSAWGTFLIMGVVGLLVAMVINMFLQSPGDGPGDQRHRRADLRRPDRLRYAEDQEHVRLCRGHRDDGQGRDHGGAQPLPRLPQHVPVPAEVHGRPPLKRIIHRS